MATACEKAPAPPRNDNLAAATVLTAAPQGRVTGTTVGATRQNGEPVSNSNSTVWFRWRAPSSGVVTFTGSSAIPPDVEAYTGPAIGHLRPVSDDNDPQDAGPVSSFRVVTGTNYAIRVTSFTGSTFSVKWATSHAPANDASTAAVAISGGAGSLVVDTTAATASTTDPKIDGAEQPATVWYRWTAPSTGVFNFDTNGSEVDTLVGAYSTATPPVALADSDGGCGQSSEFTTASIQFPATSGSTYLIMVAGTNDIGPTPASIGGPVQLNWRAVANAPVASGNDAFASATRISGTHGAIDGDTNGATAESGEPAIDGVPAQSSVWFSWTPTVTGDYVLTANPDNQDACGPALALYTGSSVSALRAVSSNDSVSLMSRTTSADTISVSSGGSGGLAVHLFAGTTYHLAADGGSDPGGFSMAWDIPQAAPTIRSVTAGNGSVGVIWSPPKPTAGSVRTGYFVTITTNNPDSFDINGPEPQLLPVTDAFTTIRGLTNGTTYRVLVAAVSGAGLGEPAISGPITPHK